MALTLVTGRIKVLPLPSLSLCSLLLPYVGILAQPHCALPVHCQPVICMDLESQQELWIATTDRGTSEFRYASRVPCISPPMIAACGDFRSSPDSSVVAELRVT